ncbi:siderophore-interacting protein [Pseudaquabacterium pictum]|uniref:Siderophore-interacting protein n=1 Tax=Pseudaquabacterium pictum TaxID=2315236 RepID=A0A480AMM5_9BURK|nr:siderophore-interacting protein [Rubrivivax pictus]GCL61282.1 siderophore-interacting protein [Rubrivivax pictus]
MSTTAPAQRRVHRVRHEIHRRTTTVVRVDRPTPGFVRVTLADPSLAGFVSDGFDDHLKLILPGDDGQPVMRDFTPAAFDRQAATLTLEFALHTSGVASDWARQARPGQTVVVAGPRGSMVEPTDFDWHLLAGDASALPAIQRRLAELPADAQAIVIVQADAADQRLLPTAAHRTLQWVPDTAALASAIDALDLPPGEGFAWCAGEAGAMARLRDLLLAKGQPKEAMRVSAYWKRGAASFHDELAI